MFCEEQRRRDHRMLKTIESRGVFTEVREESGMTTLRQIKLQEQTQEEVREAEEEEEEVEESVKSEEDCPTLFKT